MFSPRLLVPLFAIVPVTVYAHASSGAALASSTSSPRTGETETNEGGSDTIPEAPIATALAAASEDVRQFNDHVVMLASPFMEGRLPGTRGMELAKEYVEYWMKEAGLEPAFGGLGGATDYRQPFPLAGIATLEGQSLSIAGAEDFVGGEDYTALSLGGEGEASGEAVFVGYSIQNEEKGYASYAEGDDLSGKIAVMFRFEPMDEEGKSRWTENGWTGRASFQGKVRSAVDRGAAGVLIINPPGSSDPRASSLPAFSMGGAVADVPVLLCLPHVADAIFASAGSTALEMRQRADESGGLTDLGVELALACSIDRTTVTAENVGGLLPGRGEFADEYVVIGAHMDHLGMGFFGSRDQCAAGKRLHPGADDNASGTAGILLIADWMAAEYAQAPADADLRSVLFIAFSAEESGLNGARYYVENPIADLDKHALMMNFDMIGRVKNKRLGVFGVGTAKGMSEWMEPIFEDSELEIVPNDGGGGGSDHLAFISKGVPSLFAIIADFHQEYHTPLDTSDKINRVDGVQAAYLWRDIANVAVALDDDFEFVPQRRSAQTAGGRGGIKVRLGISPGNYSGDGGGVLIGGVSPGGAAEAAGLQEGDRLMTWDGKKIEDIRAWMGMLRDHEPGDEVLVGIDRADERVELTVTLQAAG